MNSYIVEKLKEGRINAKLKQSDVAEKIGMKGNTLSNYENGVSEPDIDTFCALCDIYGISPSDILNEAFGLGVQGESFKIKPSEIERLKKYRFISECSTDGTKVVDAVLDREYSIAERLKALDEEIKKLKSDNSLKNVHNLNVSTEKEKGLARFSKYVDEGADYVNAAHPIEGTLDEDKQFDEDIMDGEDF